MRGLQTFSRRWQLVAAAVMLAVFIGCDGIGTGAVSPDYVVESYLIAGESLGRVFVSSTAPIDERYDFGELVVQGADVRINLLDAGGVAEESYAFSESGLAYYPVDSNVLVQAGRRYELVVTTPDGARVSAETIVPGAFEVLSVNADSVKYQGPTQVAVNVSRSTYKNRPAIFVFSIESLDPSLESITSFYGQFIDEPDELNDVRITESPPINEQNYEINPDGSLTIQVPWIAVAFYGPNNVIANAVDDNLYDFLRSQQVQQGGSTFSPGEIPNIISHVQGGTGIFGSLSRATIQAYFAR